MKNIESAEVGLDNWFYFWRCNHCPASLNDRNKNEKTGVDVLSLGIKVYEFDI